MTRRSPLLFSAWVLVLAVLIPSTARAQHVHSGPHVAVGVGVAFGSPYYYRPYAYPWYPYSYGFWYPGPYYYGAPYYPYYYDNSSSLRLQVTPRQTEVFVDGHFAGIVDNFDGTFQRLTLEPGEHDLQLFLPGHRSVTQHIYLQPRATFRVRHTMEALAPGEPEPVRPVAMTRAPVRTLTPAPAAAPARAAEPQGPNGISVDGVQPPARAGSAGSVAIRVQPMDAEVLIDGEQWNGTSGDERLVVQLAPGPHTIEVRKDGYRGFMTEVTVNPGETTPLNVSLARPR